MREFASHTPPVTISAGVAAVSGLSMVIPSLLEDADAALYQAKQGGRNRVVLAKAADPD
jgi:diguanylate cyclase (GGDEF)-like protein